MGRRLSKEWLAVAVWITAIFATIPFVRSLREAFAIRWPVELLAFAVMGIVAAAAAVALAVSQRRRHSIRWADAAWLVAIAAVLIFWTRALMGQPEEAIHFLEYGVLGVLLYRALRLHIPDPGVFVAGALLGAIVGTVDEILQWVVPDRYWDFRDLVLNGGASVIVQIALWRVVRKTGSPVTLQTARFVCRLAACQIVLLALVLALTPQRLGELARALPFLEPLAVSSDVMCEYGFLHSLDGRTAFRSRLSRNELFDQDLQRSAEASAAFEKSRGRHGLSLRKVAPAVDPFVYEMRVHIFSRDRNLAEAPRQAEGTREHRRSMTAAARENRILEQVFGDTLSRSAFLWSDRQRTAVESVEDPDARYVSKVAGHLITAVSEPVLRFLMLAALAALVAADVILSRSPRQSTRE
jgi:hypothetical protein